MLSCLLLSSAPPPEVEAATNSAYGGIRGLNNGTLQGGDGTGTGQFILHAHRLALVKQARDLTGKVLPSGADVDSGSEIYFVLLVDNPTVAPAPDIRLDDPIPISSFEYISGSIEYSVVAPEVEDIWASTWISATDESEGDKSSDPASVTIEGEAARVTFGATSSQMNAPFDLPSGHQIAVRFRVRVR